MVMVVDTAPSIVTSCQGAIGVAVIAVAGEIDALIYSDLDHALRFAICRPNNKALILDMRGVTFMGACGIGSLLRASETAETYDVMFGVVASPRPVIRLIRLCQVEDALVVWATLHEAFEALAARGTTG